MKNVVILAGPKGCGKTTAANFMEDELGYEREAYADALKALLKRILPSIPYEYFYEQEFKNEPLDLNLFKGEDCEAELMTAKMILHHEKWFHKVVNKKAVTDEILRMKLNSYNFESIVSLGVKIWEEASLLAKKDDELILKFIEIKDSDCEITPRALMQHLGTDIMRACDDEIWIKHLVFKMAKDGDEKVIIEDARFDNEVELPREILGKLGTSVRFIELETEEGYTSEHASEEGLTCVPDAKVFNDKTTTFFNKLEEALK